MREHNDIETEIDGTEYCEVCEQPVEWTISIVVGFGEVEMCIPCLTEDADKTDADTAALRAGDNDD